MGAGQESANPPGPTPLLFVTGMQRSGTTLVDKLLSAHPAVSVLSQPLPLLYADVKRMFITGVTGETDAYPLGTLFRESPYRPDDFTRWLGEHQLSSCFLARVLDEMIGYTGQYTRLSAEQRARLLAAPAPHGVADFLAHLLAESEIEPAVLVRGVKETTCEEFLPYLLAHGWHCLLVLRDPRDIVASLNHGRGQSHAGRPKPLLFNLRQWRKSVAFALRHAHAPTFRAIRYEDLVHRPLAVLEDLGAWLGVADWPALVGSDGVGDPFGQSWAGNSSHGTRQGISRESIGLHRHYLTKAEIRFIEAACGPEMLQLGYLRTPIDDASAVLRAFVDPHAGTRPELAWYGDVAARASDEIRRLQLLRGSPSPAEIESYFLFSEAYRALAETTRR